jgi:hypothetical protein
MSMNRRLSFHGLTCALTVVLALVSTCLPARAVAQTGSTYVFYEKFTGENARQWNIQSLSDGSKTYMAGGAYRIVRARPGTMRGWPLGVHVPVGVQFNVQMRLVKGADPYEGISFWDDLANNFTLFAVTPDGNAGLFRHTSKGYAVLMDWHSVTSIHRGSGAVNKLSVNLDKLSAAQGRAFLINGVPLGKSCSDAWRKAIGSAPAAPARGLFVGVVAGSYKGASDVSVQLASMYDGTHAGPVPSCKTPKKAKAKTLSFSSLFSARAASAIAAGSPARGAFAPGRSSDG